MKYCGAGPGVTNNLIQQSVYEPCPYSNQQSTPEIVAANPSGGSSPSQVSGVSPASYLSSGWLQPIPYAFIAWLKAGALRWRHLE